ncbi:NfeD family protein [Chloroflexota bacterium]
MTSLGILIVILAIIVIAFVILVINRGIRAHRQQVSAGREDLIGKTAVVEIVLEPRGIVLVEGERWTATIDSKRAEEEEEVVITKVEGLKLQVTKKE